MHLCKQYAVILLCRNGHTDAQRRTVSRRAHYTLCVCVCVCASCAHDARRGLKALYIAGRTSPHARHPPSLCPPHTLASPLLNQSCIPSSRCSIAPAVSLSPPSGPLRARVILCCSALMARRRACSLMRGDTTRAARDQSRERIRMLIRGHCPPARPWQHETAQPHTPPSSLVSHTRYAAIHHSRHTLPPHARAPAHLRPTRFPASTSPRC